MNGPCYLAIGRNGFILVADYLNNRIIQLNASLEFICEYICRSVGLKQRLRMHSNEYRRRMYMVNETSQYLICRSSVLKHVLQCAVAFKFHISLFLIVYTAKLC